MQMRFRRADGEYRWQLVHRVPLRDGSGNVIRWYGVGSDIEDQKRAENALRKSEAYLDQAQQLSHTGSFGWNVASGDIAWSREAYQILGVDRTVAPTIDLILRHVHPDDRGIVQRVVERAMQGAQHFDYEHRWLTADGNIKHLYVRAHRVTYGSVEEIVGAVMDVTEARKAEEALSDAQTQLAHASRVATLGEMSASIAHEVNQPLAAITANAGAAVRWLTRETPDVDEALDAVTQIIGEAERAGGVIQRIRALFRKSEPEMSRLDINSLIDEVLTLVRNEALSRRVTLRLECASGLPAVYGDPIQLQQVIINLVVNGIQAMATVTDRARTLLIRTHRYDANEVLVAVQDVGIGVGPEDFDRLFNAFTLRSRTAWNGAVDLALDHRSPRRTNLGDPRRWTGHDVPVHGVDAPAMFTMIAAGASGSSAALIARAASPLTFRGGVEDAVDLDDVVVEQALDLHHGSRWIRRLAPEFCLRLVDHGGVTMQVADIYCHSHAILQARALRLGNQPDIEEGLANVSLRILDQRIGGRIDALHAGDKDEVARSDAEAPGALRLDGAGRIERPDAVRRR